MSFPTLTASNNDWKAKMASKLRAAGHGRLAELDTDDWARYFLPKNLDYKSEGHILEEIEAILDDLILEQRQTAIPIETLLENIDRKLPTLPVADPAIISHGNLSYASGGAKPIVVTVEENAVLQKFLASKTAMTTKRLEGLVSNVARVIKQLQRKFPGAVRRPETKGDGYYIAVNIA